MENEIIYPYFIACTQEEWNEWNDASTSCIMQETPDGGDNYSNPFIDADGQVYFMVNPEIEECVPEERRAGFTYDLINWPNESTENS